MPLEHRSEQAIRKALKGGNPRRALFLLVEFAARPEKFLQKSLAAPVATAALACLLCDLHEHAPDGATQYSDLYNRREAALEALEAVVSGEYGVKEASNRADLDEG